MQAAEPLDTFGTAGRDENIHGARMIAQNIVGAAAHENARFARSEVADHVALDFEQRIAAQHVAPRIFASDERRTQIADEGREQVARLLFVGFLENFGADAALLGGQIDQLLVVNADSESRRHGLADGLAAASELPPDIDDEFIFHSRGLFGVVRCRGRIHLGPEFTQLVGQHAEGHNRRQQV